MFKLVVILALVAFVLGAPKSTYTRYMSVGRIVGGEDADIADYPYQLSLVYKGFGHFCGASLIAPNWALTAAHCTYGVIATDVTVRAGSSNFIAGGQILTVSKIIQHEDFDLDSPISDIALVQLSSNVTIPTSKPIELASSKPATGRVATVSGWGRISETDVSLGSEILQVVQVPIVNQETCKSIYMNDWDDTMLCAGYLGIGGKDSCVGDSGGPLVIDDALTGIVSWGIGCAEPQYPGVYTSVPDFITWIQDNMQGSFD